MATRGGFFFACPDTSSCYTRTDPLLERQVLLKLSDFPGPTDQARELQSRQYDLLRAMYDAWNDAYAAQSVKDYGAARQDPVYQQARAAYDASVSELTALLGEDAHCNNVDCDLFSLYSDLYKDDAGFRPRHHITRAQVQAWLDRRAEPNDSDN